MVASHLSLRKLYTIAFMNDQTRHTEGSSPAAETVRLRRSDVRSKRAVVVSWVAVAAWAVFIFCMSANTGNNLEHGGSLVSQVFQWLKTMQTQVLGPGVDVVNPAAHFCEYAVFGALLANVWRFHAPFGCDARNDRRLPGCADARVCRRSSGRADACPLVFGVRENACSSRALNRCSRALVPWVAVVLAIVCASLYGVTDELHQYFVPGRACDPADWLVDTCGAALGAVLLKAFAGIAASRAKTRA